MTGHSVNLQTIYSTLDQALLVGAGVLILWVGVWFRSWLADHAKFLDAQTQQILADGLNRALQNGVSIAMNKLDAWEDVHKNVEVQGAVTAWAAQYAVDHSPQAISKFGLDPEQLAIKAAAYLPTPKSSEGTTGVTIQTPAVTVSDLPPPSPLHGN